MLTNRKRFDIIYKLSQRERQHKLRFNKGFRKVSIETEKKNKRNFKKVLTKRTRCDIITKLLDKKVC